MNPELKSVISSALVYRSYKVWKTTNTDLKGFELHRAKRDFECAGAIYRFHRRRQHQDRITRGENN